jgi:hypothetical protein
MKKVMALMLMFVCVAFLFSATPERVPTNKTDKAHMILPRAGVSQPTYRPSTRQNEVLFVEDYQGVFGTATHPDPNWDGELAAIFGVGGYGWFATTVQGQNGPDLATMQAYQMVIWNCYDDFWTGSGLTTTDMTNIAAYLAGGGKVWLIGQDVIYGGAGSFVQTNFNVASYIEDYNYNIPNASVQGLAEIAGINVNLTSDYPSNYFFSDDLTPNANAHQVLLDVGYSAYPSIFSNDHATSFWTIDGRTPNPAANWSQIVYQMLDAFGVLGAGAFWDFETGLQGWTHTNGQAFPAGWDVEPSGYKPAWTPPDAGDSTMWIDSDAAGSGVLVEDTAWSPPVVPPTNMAWLKYGLGYNNLSATSDSLYVGVMTFTSGAWNPPVQLKRYSADYGPAWDSLDVSAYSGVDSIRVYFYYSGMYDWWAGFDNVGLYAPPGEDVGVSAILEPAGVYSLNDIVTPQAQVQNYGDLDETFPVIFTMTRNAVLVYADTVDMTLVSGAIDTAAFETYTFTDAGAYDIVSYTELVGDQNPDNDTAYATASVFEWVEDFEASNGGFVADPASGAWEWGVPTSGPGAAHSGTNVWATILAGNYIDYANWKLSSQGQYTATQDNPLISFYHWYDIETVWDGGNVKYSTDNGTTWLLLYPVGGYDDIASTANAGIPAESCFTGSNATWEAEEIIIPVSSGQALNLRFHFGSDGSVQYPGWYIDDLAGLGLTVGIAEEPGTAGIAAFGFAPRMSTLANDHVSITYTTTVQGHVSLQVYDGVGRLVQTLVNTQQPAGEKSFVWNRRDMNGRTVANGVYFFKLQAENQTATHKLVLVD